jgi:hypothetical protein
MTKTMISCGLKRKYMVTPDRLSSGWSNPIMVMNRKPIRAHTHRICVFTSVTHASVTVCVFGYTGLRLCLSVCVSLYLSLRELGPK